MKINNLLNKFLLTLLIVFAFLFQGMVFSSMPAKATSTVPTNPSASEKMMERLQKVGGSSGYSTDVNEGSLSAMIGSIINILLSLLGVIFIVLTIIAGFTWMTSQGNEEKIKTATKSLQASIIGLLITVSAWSIWYFIFINLIFKQR